MTQPVHGQQDITVKTATDPIHTMIIKATELQVDMLSIYGMFSKHDAHPDATGRKREWFIGFVFQWCFLC